ncbi:MAG: CBS domain-containing protein [Lewinella sp.]|nr:CBS domain-containing protein [Lewinella sp.]
MTNTISRRVYDFLKEFPPFNMLDKEVLLGLSERVVVQYRQPEEVIFARGETPGEFIYVIREGAVHLFREEEGEEVLVDHCDEGDVFGLRPLLAADQYALTARTAEETLLYAVPIKGFESLLADNPKLSYYLARNMAAGIRRRMEANDRGRLGTTNGSQSMDTFQLLELQSIDQSKDPIVCTREQTVQSAAQIMSEAEVGSIIIVDAQQHPLGIITDKDLRRKVATGAFALHTPVSEIMSSPVRTVAPHVTVASVQIEMVKHRIHHLCVTRDGTDQSAVLGVISEHDLLVLQGNNPAVLIREVRRSHDTATMRQLRERAEELLLQYLDQEVSIAYISAIMTEINDEIIRRCIELSQAEMPGTDLIDPGLSFCWLALGSEGREEQLLRTDQDNALVFDNPPDGQYDVAKAYYLELADRITKRLNEVGFEFCPADMMGSNPEWCLSLAEWKHQFTKWIDTPTPKAVMHSTIFFDFRPVYGATKLADALTNHIFEEIDDRSLFLQHLATQALKNPPPLTFFRNFVVESSGQHEDQFDIKARAMMPLADAARLLILEAEVGHVNNTFRRFEKLAELQPDKRELYESAADAYEILMRLRAIQGLKNKDSGRYFDPAALTKMERIHLRNCFQPAKELQSMIKVRFQTAYFN